MIKQHVSIRLLSAVFVVSALSMLIHGVALAGPKSGHSPGHGGGSGPSDPAIVYISETALKPSGIARDLFVMDADGTNATKLLSGQKVTGQTLGYSTPSLSPDGTQIAVIVSNIGNACGEPELVIVDFEIIAGEPTVTNTHTALDCGNAFGFGSGSSPQWVPNGARIIVSSGNALYSVDPNSYNTPVFLRSDPGFTLKPTINTDSSKIAYIAQSTGTGAEPILTSIKAFTVLSGTGGEVIPHGSSLVIFPAGLYQIHDIDWSRNSTMISFSGHPDGIPSGSGIYTFDAGLGASTVSLVDLVTQITTVSWSPDDQAIVHDSNFNLSKPDWNIREVDVATGTATVLADDKKQQLLEPDRRRY